MNMKNVIIEDINLVSTKYNLSMRMHKTRAHTQAYTTHRHVSLHKFPPGLW